MMEYCNNYRKTTIKVKLSVLKFLIILSILMLSACGMQGDLYLPEDGTDKPAQKVN